jgi:aspartyl-tRNA(Asn)/glutamyl-tRNA(Gln) amidotransferase subunit C
MSKSKLSEEDVKHIAKLANLTLTQIEITKFQTQLSAILGYVDQLQQVNTDGVEETSQVTGLTNVFHQDNFDTQQTLSQEKATKASSHKKNNYFEVPAVIKKK